MERPSAIFFDWDGTLVDSFSFLLEAHNHVRRIFGMEPFTPSMFMEYFGQPREILYKNLYGKNRTEAKAHFEEFVLKHHLKFLKPMDGADHLVKTVHAAGIKSGVVSNKKGDFIRKEIENFGWTPMFASIVGAGDAPQDKPAADPLLLALSLAGIDGSPEKSWYVGDSETDAQCAANAGCPLVLIDHGNNITGWSDKYTSIMTIKSCRELADYVSQAFKIK